MFTGLGTYLDYRAEKWLYGQYDEQKLAMFNMLYGIDFIRPYIDYKLDQRADKEYLQRFGMDYSDIHDPRKLKQTSSAASYYGSTYRMISRNVDKLYR